MNGTCQLFMLDLVHWIVFLEVLPFCDLATALDEYCVSACMC